jgi:hypothetical protein
VDITAAEMVECSVMLTVAGVRVGVASPAAVTAAAGIFVGHGPLTLDGGRIGAVASPDITADEVIFTVHGPLTMTADAGVSMVKEKSRKRTLFIQVLINGYQKKLRYQSTKNGIKWLFREVKVS